MLKDLNILLDLGFVDIYNKEENLIGYRLYLEDLNGFMVIELNGDLYFGSEHKFMDKLGNVEDIKISNIQEFIPSLRYYMFKKIPVKKSYGFIDKCKGIFARDINA